jgi:hypothetical protein
VPLEYAEQCGDVAGPIVDNLRFRHQTPAKEHAAHSDEHLAIAGMRDLLDESGEPLRQLLLSADITCRRLHRINRVKLKQLHKRFFQDFRRMLPRPVKAAGAAFVLLACWAGLARTLPPSGVDAPGRPQRGE